MTRLGSPERASDEFAHSALFCLTLSTRMRNLHMRAGDLNGVNRRRPAAGAQAQGAQGARVLPPLLQTMRRAGSAPDMRELVDLLGFHPRLDLTGQRMVGSVAEPSGRRVNGCPREAAML